MKKVVVSFIGVAALATVGMAAAAVGMDAPAQTFSNCVAGIYVNGGLGYSDVFATPSHYSASSVSRGAFAFDALLGYQFNPYLALETSYISFGHASLHYVAAGSIKDTLSGFGVNARGIYPVNNKVDLFATAGIIRMTETFSVNTYAADNHAWTPALGLGADYLLTKMMAITAQDIFAFQNSSTNMPAVNAFLVGLSYKIDI